MTEVKRDRTLLNVIATVSFQVITLLSGFIIPRLILGAFGSEINGLVSSITQFLNYISLLEGGVSAVILANLYKPLATKDNEKISAVVVTAESFFKKLALIFLVYQFVLAAVYPFFIKSELSWGYVASLTLILGLSIFIQYYFALTWRLLLQADKKMYVSVLVQGTAVILNLAATVILIRLYPSIHVVKFAAGVVFFVQPLILNRYVDRNYTLDRKATPDPRLLAQRWDGFGINIAAMIHASTATVVLTFVGELTDVSVFSVYLFIANGLKSLITSISGGIVPTIGNAYGKGDLEECGRLFGVYDLIMFFVSFLVFTVAAATAAPFAMVYTSGVTDANYYRPLLGLLLMAGECVFCIRDPYVNMAYSANHFRRVSKYAYAEAAINVVLSVLFGIFWGMDGVALGLLISIAFRTVAQAIYLKHNILRRPLGSFLIKLLCFSLAAVISFLLCARLYEISSYSWMDWILFAMKVGFTSLPFMLAAAFISARRECVQLINAVFGRKG